MPAETYRITRFLFWIALVGSYILAVLPQEEVPELTPFSDKGNHFIAFAVLTTLLLDAYRIKYLSAFGWMLLYGIFIEISQLFTASRNSELLDVVADSIGAVIGILLYRLIRRFYPE